MSRSSLHPNRSGNSLKGLLFVVFSPILLYLGREKLSLPAYAETAEEVAWVEVDRGGRRQTTMLRFGTTSGRVYSISASILNRLSTVEATASELRSEGEAEVVHWDRAVRNGIYPAVGLRVGSVEVPPDLGRRRDRFNRIVAWAMPAISLITGLTVLFGRRVPPLRRFQDWLSE
jgi:hypothetical protein